MKKVEKRADQVINEDPGGWLKLRRDLTICFGIAMVLGSVVGVIIGLSLHA